MWCKQKSKQENIWRWKILGIRLSTFPVLLGNGWVVVYYLGFIIKVSTVQLSVQASLISEKSLAGKKNYGWLSAVTEMAVR